MIGIGLAATALPDLPRLAAARHRVDMADRGRLGAHVAALNQSHPYVHSSWAINRRLECDLFDAYDIQMDWILDVRLFGCLIIRPAPGREFPANLRSRARTLLALLLLKHHEDLPRPLVERAFRLYDEPRDELRRAIWDLTEAFRMLEPERSEKRLRWIGDCLRLDRDGIRVDVCEFDAAAAGNDLRQWQKAVDLYQHDPLEYDDTGLLDLDWVRSAQSVRRDRTIGMLESLAAVYQQRGDLPGAEICLERLHSIEPLRGDILAKLLDVVCSQAKYNKASRIHLRSASNRLDRESADAASAILTEVKAKLFQAISSRRADKSLRCGRADNTRYIARIRSIRPEWASSRVQQYKVTQATERDRKWIMMQKELAYPDELFLPVGRAKQWYDRYPCGMSIIKKAGRRIGHVNLLAVNRPVMDRFIAGEIGEEGIRACDLLNDRGSIRDLYLESLVTGTAYPSAEGAILLNLKSIIRRVCDPDSLDRIYTQPVSDALRRLVLDLGFELVSAAEARKDRQDLWSIEYARLQEFTTAFYAPDEP